MTKLKVCEQLLLIIQLVHSKKEHDLILCELGLNSDWYASTKAAFYELPDTLFATTGLKKNDRCFNAIFKMAFRIVGCPLTYQNWANSLLHSNGCHL